MYIPTIVQQLMKHIQDLIREGRDTYEIEHRIIRKSTGEVRIVHEKCEHFRDSSNRIVPVSRNGS